MSENTGVAQENAVVVAGENEGTQIVTTQQTIQQILIGGSQNFLTSVVDDGTPATRAKIYNAISDNTAKIRDMIGKEIHVTDFMAYPCQVINTQTGEISDVYRVVLIAEDGSSYGSVSQGVIDSVKNIISICGMAPWTPALKISPVEKETRRGFRTLTFRMIP